MKLVVFWTILMDGMTNGVKRVPMDMAPAITGR
jgi:hypothetical protein